MKNTIKKLDTLQDKDGLPTTLYEVSSKGCYSDYYLLITSPDSSTPNNLVLSITDIRGVLLRQFDKALEVKEWLEQIELDSENLFIESVLREVDKLGL